jgi:hypothetical protein
MRVNFREILIRKATTGVDQLVDIILSTEDSPQKALYAKAKEINVSNLKRGYVEASLLCSTDFDKISELLEIPIPVLEMYLDVFYNIQDFDKLSKLELLEVKDRQESLLKIWAVSQGLDFIAWRLGHKVTISPTDGLVDLFTTCMYKSKEAMFAGNAAEESKEATKWVKLSLDIARLIKLWIMDSGAAKKDIELALQEVIPDFEGFDALDAFPDSFNDKG